jgi:hypothetical protein
LILYGRYNLILPWKITLEIGYDWLNMFNRVRNSWLDLFVKLPNES